ncbi:cotton fiber protein [Anaeramoeba flamelloides]|uniref:Cotton fiber protein n=1 Tax=Anaeramoeba flamelloides TaxID=1746091 RepID=A0ABQ8YC43_9EUKA|nr:cotton fiber protein [Anaeramoeba flamelloides]
MGNTTPHKTLSQKSWKKYLKMIAKSKEAILLIDEKISFSYFNRHAAQMLKIKNRKGVKLTPALISPLNQPHLGVDSSSGSQAVVQNVYKSKDGRFDYVWQYQKVTGELFFARVYLTILRVKKKTHCQCIWRPIKDPNEILTSSIGSFGSIGSLYDSFKSFNSINSYTSNTSFGSVISNSSNNSLSSFGKKIQEINLNSKNNLLSKSTNELSSTNNLSTNNQSTDNQSLTKSINSTISKDYKSNLNDTKSSLAQNTNYNSRQNNKVKNNYLPIMILEMDIDEEFMEFQDNIKKAVRSTNDLMAEKKIFDEFNRFETIFNTSLKKRENHIQKLTKRTKKTKMDTKKKYQKLENQLQKRLFSYHEQIEKRKKIEEENRKLKEKLLKFKKIFDKQKKILDKFIFLFDENELENN